MSDDRRRAILAGIAKTRRRLATLHAREAAIYEERVRLYEEGRALTPPLTQREMANAAGISEVAVIQALRKAREQAAVAESA